MTIATAPTTEQWQQMVRLRRSPNVAGRLASTEFGLCGYRAFWQRANRLALCRAAAKRISDPLQSALNSRPARTPTAKEAARLTAAARQSAAATKFDADLLALDRARRIRADLLRAARVARQMGWSCKASHDHNGCVSSYYVSRPDNPRRQLRVSDHDVPATDERHARAEMRGLASHNGSADIYASDSDLRRPVWWRRAFALAFAERNVPGAE